MTTVQATIVFALAIVGGILATIENSKSKFQNGIAWSVMSLAVSVCFVAYVLVK